MAVMVAPGLSGRRGHCEEPEPSQEGRAGVFTVAQQVSLAALPW